MEAIEQLTDEKGGAIHINDVLEAVPHTEKRARHIIRNKITDGTLIEAPDDHVSPRD